MTHDVTETTIEAVRTFLEPRIETSLFLLHCLERHGPRLGKHPDSGNFRCVIEDGRVAAVWSATLRGHLLVDTGGREDLAGFVIEACAREAIRLDGVVAEWTAAQSIWPTLRDRAGFRVTAEAKHVAYRLLVDDFEAPPAPEGQVLRVLDLKDFDQWYPLFHALEVQEGIQIHGDREDVRGHFAYAPWRWWGAFEGDQLAAVACLDVTYGETGNVGGIYVRADHRRKGLARTILGAVLQDSRLTRHLSRLVLFAREDNGSARRLYEGMGFEPAGAFGFMIGEWAEDQKP